MAKTKRRRAKESHTTPGTPPPPLRSSAESFLVGRRWLRLFFLGGLTVLTLLPFTGKAFHMDDPMYVWAARQIQEKPLDPYGFDVNWYGFPMRMYDVMKNPPLTSYYIAGVGMAFGWDERTLHLAFLIPAVAVILGTFMLAKRLCPRPLLAGICTLFTPVFLVSSTNLMSDTLMLAFWVYAAHLWLNGIERSSRLRLFGSGVLIACSALAKYYGMALIPLLFVYSLLEHRRLRWSMAFLLVPVVLLGAYQWATHELYGRGLLLDAAAYATEAAPSQWGRWSAAKVLIGLAFTGGCLGGVWAFTLWKWPRWTWLVGLAMVATVLTVATTGSIGGSVLRVAEGNVWMTTTLFAVFATAGLSVIALGVEEVVTRRDAESWLLCLWVLGTFAFAAGVNWTTSGRSILPMVPAAAILIARRIGSRQGGKAPTTRRTVTVAACAAVLAIGVAWADLAYAESARVAAKRIHDKYGGKTQEMHFTGHWGFQYYMEALGAKAINVKATSARTGDILVLPQNNSNPSQLTETKSLRFMEMIEIPSSKWIATMRLGAGFYADDWGPVPFVVGEVPPERYQIFSLSFSSE